MPKLDPLSIPTVLETILDFLDTKHVAVCRLVNSTWNATAVKILESRVEIAFHSSEHLRGFNEAFTMPMEDISVKFQSFHFATDLFTQAVDDVAFGALKRLHQNLQKFVNLMGQQVTKLRLVIRPFLQTPYDGVDNHQRLTTAMVMFLEALEMIYNYFPNVGNLKLLFILSSSSSTASINNTWDFECTRLMDSYEGKSLQNLTNAQIDLEIAPEQQHFLQQNEFNQDDGELVEFRMIKFFTRILLSTAVNLQYISCSNHSTTASLQQSLIQSFSSIPPSSFKEINVCLVISLDDILSLCTYHFSNLNSAYFEISTGNPEETIPALKELFAQLRCTLQSLYLSFDKFSRDIFEPLPLNVLMKQLKHLKLEQFEGYINFKKLPALKQLTLKQCCLEGIVKSVVNLSQTTYSSLNSLEIHEGAMDKKEDIANLFTEVAPYIFPQLHNLTITKLPCIIPLSSIFSQCQQLKSLTILKCGGGVTDSTVCGVRDSLINFACPMEPVFQNIGKGTDDNCVFQKMLAKAKSPAQACIREYPFIGDLKQLQFLTLEGNFSDVSVLYGIILCDKLVRLNLRSDICTWRSVRIIQLALVRLISASFNGKKLSLCN